MKRIIIANGTIVTAEDTYKSDILIVDGVIAKIEKKLADKEEADIILDARDNYVFPAFVDMHAHFREPGFEHKEDIASGSKAAVAGGYGAVACMPNTKPVIDNVPLVKYILEKSAEANLAKVLPVGAITKGQNGVELAELKLMSEAGAVAFSDDGKAVGNSQIMRLALEYAGGNDLLLMCHCEDVNLTDNGVVNEGYNATVAGLRGVSRASEEVGIARDVIIAASLNVPVHIAHVSTKESVDLIRYFKERGAKVTCETAPHYFSATDDCILDYNTSSKINPPLREMEDVQAIIQGLADGTIDVIATDHAPHNSEEKDIEYALASSGTIGLQTAYPLALSRLVEEKTKININDLVKLMSFNPAKILKLKDFGDIQEGMSANITIADKTEFVFDEDMILSKSKNSLFKGWRMKGKIRYTIVDGDIKYAAEPEHTKE